MEKVCASFGFAALLERISTSRSALNSDKVELKHVEVKAEGPVAEEQVLAQVPLNAERLLNFLDTEQFADVALSAGGQGEVIRAHRVVLSAWSAPLCRVRH